MENEKVEEKKFEINGVLVSESELTQKDLEYICEHCIVDINFIEKYIVYLTREALYKLSENMNSMNENVIKVINSWIKESENIRSSKAEYFLCNVMSTSANIHPWVLDKYGDILNWNVVNLFYDATDLIESYSQRIVPSKLIHNDSFIRLISRELEVYLFNPTNTNRYEELESYVNSSGMSVGRYLGQNAYLTQEMIFELGSKLDVLDLAANENIHIDLIIPKMNKEDSSQKYDLTESREFTDEQVYKYRDYIDWIVLSEIHTFSEELIQRCGRYVDWVRISLNQKMSAEFIEENIDNVYMHEILRNNNMEFNELLKLYNLLSEGEKVLLGERRDATEEYLEELIARGIGLTRSFWLSVSRNSNISEVFLEKYRENIDWYIVCLNKNLTRDFVMENIDKLSINRLILNPLLSIELIKELEELIQFKNKF